MARLLGLGLLLCLSVNFSTCDSDSDSNSIKRQIRSLTSHLRSLVEKDTRFVGQLATDCGMDCKRDNEEKGKPEARGLEDQIQGAKKRFMSLGASDCGSFECVLRKRLAMEKVKRFLTENMKQRASSDKSSNTVPHQTTKRRHKRYLDILLGNPGPYDQSSDYGSKSAWEHDNNYGSYGWNNYRNDYNNYNYDYNDDYYDDYDYGSASGSAYYDDEDDTEHN